MKTFALVTITAQPAVLDSRQIPVPAPEGCEPCYHASLPLPQKCWAGTSEKIFGSCKACCKN
ncbi:hypothetical protein COCC4DRAFT_179333, partial [Bipolaris maydis ATCC 48331]